MTPEDIEETKECLRKFPNVSAPVSELMQKLTKRVKHEKHKTQKGLSFLDLKIMIYSNYLANLSYYIYKKANGEQIECDPVVERLIELRIVMEKIKPIEEKLKYQINKLLSYVSSENIDSNDPLKFKANPDNLDLQEEEEDDSEQKGSKVYVPPKITAAYYDEDDMEQKRALEKARKKALSSTMLQELRKEYETGPDEIKEMHDPYKMKISEELKERERFEEEYMMRLPMTKKQRHELKQLTTVTNFNVKFDDISALEMTPGAMQLKKKAGAKKGKFKYRGKKKGAKRKR